MDLSSFQKLGKTSVFQQKLSDWVKETYLRTGAQGHSFRETKIKSPQRASTPWTLCEFLEGFRWV